MKVKSLLVMGLALLVCASAANANLVVNGDFEAGSLSGWTVFTTANGTNGTGLPDVVLFDTNNDTVATNSARFNVGLVDFNGPAGGGGITQTVNVTSAGSFQLKADIAMLDNQGSGNSAGGLFELLLDGAVVDFHDFGSAVLNVTEFALLANLSNVSAGNHDVAIRMTRPFTSSFSASPFQFIDNVSFASVADSVPEPTTASLALLGLGGLMMRRRRMA